MLYNPLKYNIIYNSNYALHSKKHTRYNMRCIMYYSLKKKHGITLIRVSDFSSHSYPPPSLSLSLSLSLGDSETPSSLSAIRFRNPKLSLSLGDSETPSIPTTRQSSVFQTCAGFINNGGCGWKMMTLVGGQIGMILWMRMQPAQPQQLYMPYQLL
ncbi:hypothetical protein HanLR1_Chr04g0124761 [Helianthus annuus]|nr:hypothetical protein HanLR1_Chr04g0124761 [Helianthus annuus]